MQTVKLEPVDDGVAAIMIDGEQIGELRRQHRNLWEARMTRHQKYTGREFGGPKHARAFFEEQLDAEPAAYGWTVVWTDGTSESGCAEGALAAYDAVSTVVTHATSPQRERPKKLLLHTVGRADGELSSTAHVEGPGRHELHADGAHFDPHRQGPGLPIHLPATAAPA